MRGGMHAIYKYINMIWSDTSWSCLCFFWGFHFIQGDRDGGVANTFRCDVITFGYLLDGTKAFPNRLLDCHHLCVHGRRGKRSSSDDARGIFGNWQTPTWSPAPGSARSSGSGGSRPRGFYQRCTPEVYMKWQINQVSLYNNVKSSKNSGDYPPNVRRFRITSGRRRLNANRTGQIVVLQLADVQETVAGFFAIVVVVIRIVIRCTAEFKKNYYKWLFFIPKSKWTHLSIHRNRISPRYSSSKSPPNICRTNKI